MLVVVGRIGVPSLFFLARLRVLSLCRITLLWVDILVCCPVELFGTPPVREIGLLWSWCLTQLLSHVFLVAVCFRVGRVVEQLVELLGQRLLLDRILCLVAFWCCFRGAVVGSLGLCLDYRLLVWVAIEIWYPLPRIVGLFDLSGWQ